MENAGQIAAISKVQAVIEFNLDVDGRKAAEDVREKVALIRPQLRDEGDRNKPGYRVRQQTRDFVSLLRLAAGRGAAGRGGARRGAARRGGVGRRRGGAGCGGGGARRGGEEAGLTCLRPCPQGARSRGRPSQARGTWAW